jgi:enoyl-CoA hydratase
MGYEFVDLEIKGHIAILALARTKSYNALNNAFAKEITEAFRELDNREEVRAVILMSKARIFCAGLDVKEFHSLGVGNSAKSSIEFPRTIAPIFDCCNVIETCRKPVIAAVHGMCIGGGLDMIAACDIRLCTEDATFSLREAGIGFVADMGVLQRLPLIIGQGFTREMAFTAQKYSARDVERMGLVNSVHPGLEAMMAEAMKMAGEIAKNAPLAVHATKEVLNYSRKADILDGMTSAIQKNSVLLFSEDVREAFTAFGERRTPDFKGR